MDAYIEGGCLASLEARTEGFASCVQPASEMQIADKIEQRDSHSPPLFRKITPTWSRGSPTSTTTSTWLFAFCPPPVPSSPPPYHIPRMATLTHTKSETVSTLDSDLAASVPAPFPAFTRVQSSRGAPSILLSQPQQQGSTQQLVGVTMDVSQQPALPVGVEAAETAQLANALVGEEVVAAMPRLISSICRWSKRLLSQLSLL